MKRTGWEGLLNQSSSIWYTWVEMPCWFSCLNSWISSLHGIADGLVFVPNGNRWRTYVLWHHCRVNSSHDCVWEVSGVCYLVKLQGSRGCVDLFVLHLLYLVYSGHCVEGSEELRSDHLFGLVFSVASKQPTPEEHVHLSCFWLNFCEFHVQNVPASSDRSSQSSNFTSLSHRATHTVNLRLLSIPRCLGLVPPRFFPDVECFQVVYRLSPSASAVWFHVPSPSEKEPSSTVPHIVFMNPEMLGNYHRLLIIFCTH